VINSPDCTMERINSVARLLRYTHKFKGYIHLKIIPGASDAAIEDSFSLASAVSLNIETPGKKHFEVLSHKKDYMNDIIRPLKLMGMLTERGSRFSGIKCTTQFIVGASDEKDSEIIRDTFGLYQRLNFKRVYFSAYQKGLGEPDIPGERQVPSNPETLFMREHRLYQVDFLIRGYGFRKDDILLDHAGNLRLDKDPKQVWADSNPGYYPVRINSADKEQLLKVPGLGPDTVKRIVKMRRQGKIRRLEDLGIRGKRMEKTKRYVIFD